MGVVIAPILYLFISFITITIMYMRYPKKIIPAGTIIKSKKNPPIPLVIAVHTISKKAPTSK